MSEIDVELVAKGNGRYTLKILVDVEFRPDGAEVVNVEQSISKNRRRMSNLPDSVAMLMRELFPSMQEIEMRKFYYALYDAGETGMTKREVMRHCGASMNSVKFDLISEELLKYGWLENKYVVSPNGGRPKSVWTLREVK